MERKTSILILSGLLLASFFAPAIKWEGFTMSGFDFVVSEYTPAIKYILLAIPFCALCLLVGALVDQENIMRSKPLLRTPLIALVLLLVLLFSNAENRLAIGSVDPFTIFNLGFWMLLVVSLLLPGLRKRTTIYRVKQDFVEN